LVICNLQEWHSHAPPDLTIQHRK